MRDRQVKAASIQVRKLKCVLFQRIEKSLDHPAFAVTVLILKAAPRG